VSDETKAEVNEAEAEAASPATEARERPSAKTAELFTPEVAALARKGVPVAWLAAAVVAGFLWGVQMVLLVLAAGAITLVIVLMWGSVQSLTGTAKLGFEEALGMGAPSKVEEEKRAVLRALKDLEYERGVGKISPEDYAELLAKYRAEAKRLIQSVDEALGPARAEVEKSLTERLARAGLTAPSTRATETETETETDARKTSDDAEPEDPEMGEEKPAKSPGTSQPDAATHDDAEEGKP
jgi:hypothetical protein